VIFVIGFVAWTAFALVCYAFLRKATYNVLDPLFVTHAFVPFAGAQLSVLCATGLIAWVYFHLFCLTLAAYLVGGRLASAFFERDVFRRLIVESVDRMRRSEVNAILFITVALTFVLAILAVQYGAQGDARQGFARLFRPLVVLQGGLFLFSLVLLLSRRLSTAMVVAWITMLVVPSIAFSGKSVLLPIIYWFGMRLFIHGKAVSLRAGIGMFAVVLLGVGIMGVLAYRASNATALFYLFVNRVWMSGETYIYAYQWDALASLRGSYHVSFTAYMLHPITSLVGIRAYDKPLGGMLFTEATGSDVLAGPNPILPVLLDYFFPGAVVVPVVASFVIGVLVLGIRPMGIALARSRSRYFRLGGIAAAVFCPSMGFLDTSLVLISLIGVAAVAVIGLLMELAFTRRPTPHAAPMATS